MNASFYTASVGAMTEQDRMNVISNNFANVNTAGYKAKDAVFMDLLYYNMHSYDRISTGTGVKVQHTNTDFGQNGFDAVQDTQENGWNFAIEGEGFFMLQNQYNNDITYTRAGNFFLSLHNDGRFYLQSDNQKLVLDANRRPITFANGELSADPGIFNFANTNGMLSVGNTEFTPVAKNGDPYVYNDARLVKGYLEQSNVDVAKEMSDTIITSRAYSYALKMIQTSDEIEETINGLRQ